MKKNKNIQNSNPKLSAIQKQLQQLLAQYPGNITNADSKSKKSNKQIKKQNDKILKTIQDQGVNKGSNQDINDESYDNFIKNIDKGKGNVNLFPEYQQMNNQTKKKHKKQKKTKKTIKIFEQQSQEISAPSKPITPYMLFHIQKSSELKHKKLIAVSLSKQRTHRGSTINQQKFKQTLSDSLSIFQKWNQMSMLQKDQYYLQYENRLRKYNMLNQQYLLLTNKKRILNPYNRFYRHEYGILQVQAKYTLQQMTHIIKDKWQRATKQQKQIYQLQEKEQKLQMENILKNKEDRIKAYREKLVQYQKEQYLYKLDILDKYHLAPKEFHQIADLVDNEKLLRNYQKKLERDRKRQRMQKSMQQRIKINQKKLDQIQQKQILQIKLQKYQSLGVPRDILITPFKTTIKQKQSQTSLNTSASKPQNSRSHSYQEQHSQKSSISLQIQQDYNYNEGKDQIENQDRSQRVPGVSTFKKIMDQLRQQQLYFQL